MYITRTICLWLFGRKVEPMPLGIPPGSTRVIGRPESHDTLLGAGRRTTFHFLENYRSIVAKPLQDKEVGPKRVVV